MQFCMFRFCYSETQNSFMKDAHPMALQVTKLCDFGSGDGADIVCSVAWSQRGTYLSVGTHSGEAQIWDVSKIKLCAPVHRLHS